jgi:hypothetical protein
MAVVRRTVWIANDILTAADLNAEFNLLVGASGQEVSFPRTDTADFDGETLVLGPGAGTTLDTPTDDEVVLAIDGTDTFSFTATELTILGRRVLTVDDLRKSGVEAVRHIVYDNRNRIAELWNSNDAVLAAQSFGF